jgi:two-component system sensor histidine kinase KdpD
MTILEHMRSLLGQALAVQDIRWRAARGVLAAVLGVAAATLCIGAISHVAHVANISLLYLPVVLWLAAAYGRGPALLASILAFLAYDFFFIPPLHGLTVDDPAQWLSLAALLATALVLGQLTATVQAQAHEARESQQRTATLYGLAQLMVSATDADAVLGALATHVVTVFAPAGVRACTINLADTHGRLRTRASAPVDDPLVTALSLGDREQAALADWVLHAGAVAGGILPMAASATHEERVAYYVPLRSGQRTVGVLGVAGPALLRHLVAGLPVRRSVAATADSPAEPTTHDPRVELFRAFCDQLALAVDRLALQQDAVHAEALRESDTLKNALLGSVTHDLRTPLASIQAATSSLLEPGVSWGEAERREFLETIQTSADRLSRLVSNLLDLSRLEAGAALPQKRWYPIGDVIATVLDRLDTTGQTREHVIEVDVAEDVPLVPMDHAQMEQVLTNLLENAIKYSPAGSAIRVHVRTRGADDSLEVHISDEGIGIPASELSAIFDKFYRVQHAQVPWASQRPPTGTGLGLAICAGIVQAHLGRIWAESRPGAGATFTFTLPIPAEPPQGALPALDETPEMPEVTAPGADRAESAISADGAPASAEPAESAPSTAASAPAHRRRQTRHDT